MEKIVTNINNIKEKNVTELVKKVKILLINSSNELILTSISSII